LTFRKRDRTTTLRKRAIRTMLLSGLLLMLLLPLIPGRTANAHPLGNFTVNHYSMVTFAGGGVSVFYVLDMAEIPTFEVLRRYDIEGDGKLSDEDRQLYYEEMVPALIEYIELTVAGERVQLQDSSRSIELSIGDVGLPVLRVELVLEGRLPAGWEGSTGSYIDRTYEGRLGWREVVVRGGPGIEIADSTAPEHDVSNALREYPEALLEAPVNDTLVTFRLEAGPGPVYDDNPAVSGSETTGGGFGTGRLTSVVSDGRLTPGILALTILLALVWGGAHALTPGHGKAVVAAYLIGTRGTARHAAFLGLTVTLTHTAGVFALALVTLSLSHFFLPEDLYPWMSVASGLLVVTIGLTLLYGRTIGRRDEVQSPVQHSHGGMSHSHVPPAANTVSTRSLLALGVSGGVVPCPSALVLLLAAISVQRLELGVVLVLAFSIGLAGVLTGIGLLVVYARWLLRRFSFEATVPRFVPAASALVISIAGAAILIDSLGQTGML
jgi:nickel/cobalt transporter (NicO) family protein